MKLKQHFVLLFVVRSYGLSRIRGDETFLLPFLGGITSPTDWAELEAMKRQTNLAEDDLLVSYGLSRIRGDETMFYMIRHYDSGSYGLSRIRGDETLVQERRSLLYRSYGLSRIRGDETQFLTFCSRIYNVLRIEPN